MTKKRAGAPRMVLRATVVLEDRRTRRRRARADQRRHAVEESRDKGEGEDKQAPPS